MSEHPLRVPCRSCGGTSGWIDTRNGQDCVFCACGRFQYNAPKTETGREERTAATVHNGIRPKQRARILQRATGRCEICGARGNLHVGHVISVERAVAEGLSDQEINSDENLAAMCDECNLGVGSEPVPLRLAIALVLARLEAKP